MPNHWSRYWPTNPLRPNASSSATPPTTGGSTSGRVTRARTSRSPGNSVRASTQASGTPTTQRDRRGDASTSTARACSASPACEPCRIAQASPHGRADISPASGMTRNADRHERRDEQRRAAPTAARPPPPPAASRSRGLSRRGAGAGASRGRSRRGRSRLLEAGRGQHGSHPPGTARSRRRRPPPRRWRSWSARRSGSSVEALTSAGISTPLTLSPAAMHVGHVDDAGVDLAELHLAEHRLHVGLEGHRLDGDLGVGEHLLGRRHRTAPGAGTARS